MSEPQSVKNAYILTGESDVSRSLAQRTLTHDVVYIVPYLDSLPPDFVFCDIGCGPGSISLDVAQRYPRCTVLGVDASQSDIKIAKESAAERKVSNAQFVVGDALNLESAASTPGFEALRGGCDFVHCHQVIVHITNPVRMLEQMRSTLKPSGILGSREADPDLFTAYPLNEGMKTLFHHMGPFLSRNGADVNVAPKLVKHSLAAGFKRDNISAKMGGMVYSTPAERAYFFDLLTNTVGKGSFGKMFEAEGSKVSDLMEQFQEWRDDEGAWVGMGVVEMICKNSA